ncbi:hypothetical protein F7018_17495 [Tenacibaculum aiptasiae]|uniref:T9SS type A sorting domain-containing protein n=1 Tax=Tenacibaculum aiptasiae TaxID=426481 RepID=A0A7J5A6E8_9FLAO|nr:hypothetical protein [Tenacibaculum aiptasiae]KAB1153141.1 hypothetical protein F7018_17495 [Tenacibaculum aiptasiae]
MKKKQLFFTSLFLCLFVNSFAQIINFTDNNFKNALLNHSPAIDTDNNNQIDVNEALAVVRLELDNKNISNLEGIQYFTNLEILKCSDNNIKEIKTETLTKLRFIVAERNQIKTIDVRNCIIWGLRLYDNPLEYAYLTGNSTFQIEGTYGVWFKLDKIKYVCISQAQYDVQPNNVDHRGFWDQIGSALHIGECTIQTPPTGCQIINFPDPNFKQALLSNGNAIPVDQDGDGEICIEEAEKAIIIDIEKSNVSNISGIEYFKNITTFYGDENSITDANFSNNPKLTHINLEKNLISSINLNNNSKLTNLSLSENKLTTIDLSNNINLKYLLISQNNLTNINIRNNKLLIGATLHYNKLSQIDVSNNTKLSSLWLSHNELNQIDISKNTELKSFLIGHNKLTQIDVSKNSNLTSLQIEWNKKIAHINLSNNLNLEVFDAYENDIKSVDLKVNTKLRILNLGFNPIKELDISKNVNLKHLNVSATIINELDIRNCNSLRIFHAGYNFHLKRLYLTGNHEFYQYLTNSAYFNIKETPNLTFACVNPLYLSQTSNYIKNTLGYSSCTVTTNCNAPTTNFETYFILSPNPTDSYLFLTMLDPGTVTATSASVYNSQTGAFIKNVVLHFDNGELSPNKGLTDKIDINFNTPIKNGPVAFGSAKIDANDLQRGTYILRVQTNVGTFSTTFIKSTQAIR